MNFIGLPSPSAYVKKYLIVVDKNYHDLKVPKHLEIKKEFFHITECFLKVNGEEVDGKIDDNSTSILKKIGKNDSFIYSHEIRFVRNNEKIQKKRQITAREYIELLEMKDQAKVIIRKIR